MRHPQHSPVAAELAEMILETIEAWETESDDCLAFTDRTWRIAEAIHLLTWMRPHVHAPLWLLFDEERPTSAIRPQL